jgi:hypothetical protein
MSFKILLRRVAEKTSPGRAPGYGEAQTLRALEIAAGSPMGRAALGTRLGVGEGVVRTLLRHLASEKLVEVSTKGITASENGQRLLDDVHSIIVRGAIAPATEDTVGGINYALLVRGVAYKIRKGLEQRDAALLVGARGATTITISGGAVLIPGMDRKPAKPLLSLIETLGAGDGDAVVIGTGDTEIEAEIGAYAAALTLA